MSLIILAVLCYLIGSIPFGLLLTKAAGLGDIRSIGSGNIGATNVLRTGKKKLAAFTLFLDMLKGLIAVYFGGWMVDGMEGLAALCVVLGHMYPVWLKFKGGKGVATAFGVLFALSFPLGLSVAANWLIIFYFSRISSFAGLSSFFMAPIYALFAKVPFLNTLFILPIVFLIFLRHRENIKRLLKGVEPKTTFKKQADQPQ